MTKFVLIANARSGSTYLRTLLACHEDVQMKRELLNSEEIIKEKENIINVVNKELEDTSKKYSGFKILVDQFYDLNLNSGHFFRSIQAKFVIVLWRNDLLETLVSLRIAEKTNVWYKPIGSDDLSLKEVFLTEQEIYEYYEEQTKHWRHIANDWPIELTPIFVNYEDFTKDPINQVKKIFRNMFINPDGQDYSSDSERMNPNDISKKITNWNQLSYQVKQLRINAAQIFQESFEKSLKIPNEKFCLVPDREPINLKNELKYRVAQPHISEKSIDYVNEALYSKNISSASKWIKLLSSHLKQLYQVPVAIPTSNGFTALFLALQASYIEQGDEIICPTFTMVAVPNAIHFMNAKPVFCDNAKNSYNPDWDQIAKCITNKTKAVIICHTYGVPIEYENLKIIIDECKKRNLILIEDISECVGIRIKIDSNKDQILGSFGDYACASMYANKIVNAGDGGFILSKKNEDEPLIESLLNHGFSKSYHFLHFRPAINCKINGLGAAFALGSFESLDKLMNHRNCISQIYRKELSVIKPIKLMPTCGYFDTPWVFGFECESKSVRTLLRKHLIENGIETRDYFFPLHLQPAYSYMLGENLNCFSNSEMLASTGFYLPTHSNLTENDVKYICSKIYEFYNLSHIDHIEYPIKPKSILIKFNMDEFRFQIKEFDQQGNIECITNSQNHVLHEIISFQYDIDYFFKNEDWDESFNLLEKIKLLKKKLKNKYPELIDYYEPLIIYLGNQLKYENNFNSSWIDEIFDAELSLNLEKISTTTESETLKLIHWLARKNEPLMILEYGCWLGASSLILAHASKKSNVYAVDNFIWQYWMNQYDSSFHLGQDFENIFRENVKSCQERIFSFKMSFETDVLPVEIENSKFDLVFLDFTRDSNELEKYWIQLRKCLKPNKTIIVLNSVCYSLLEFLNKFNDDLEFTGIRTNQCKVYKYKSTEAAAAAAADTKCLSLERKLQFFKTDDWDHLHNDVFGKCISILENKYHDTDSQILFLSAVEVAICDHKDLLFNNKWVGIIHSSINHPDLYYVPDLNTLCFSNKYDYLMKNCLGLFTLTKHQCDYLRENLKFKIPITNLYYPFIFNSDNNNNNALKSNQTLLDKMKSNQSINLVFVGNYARDYDHFINIDISQLKQLSKHFLSPNEIARSKILKHNTSNDNNKIGIIERLNEQEYESLLNESIIFLSLKNEGAANTIILECIARNVPILVPKIHSCLSYIGDNYPMLFQVGQIDFNELITAENVIQSIEYLKKMDKSKFSTDSFCNDIEKSLVFQSIPPMISSSQDRFDITICICSYKRTHNLSNILDRLWTKQNFNKNVEIIVWNNNFSRKKLVDSICQAYIRRNSTCKKLDLINSSDNYYCMIRFALANLIKSDKLLICDDDIIPDENFINFFYNANHSYPNDILCSRGHKFLEHKLNYEEPKKVWNDYESLRFISDEANEQTIHFVHADTCLIPKQALLEVNSVELPDTDFKLVDDYWMSYVLSHKFKRNLRKLKVCKNDRVFIRTDDSDEPGLALHTRAEVKDARNRMYIHHMLNNWPNFKILDQQVISNKSSKWNEYFVGFNINSSISDDSIDYLAEIGIKVVRIGAVGLGDEMNYEFLSLKTNTYETLEKLEVLVNKLLLKGISIVFSLDRRLANVEIWTNLIRCVRKYSNVIGYDLINEPELEIDAEMHWFEIKDKLKFHLDEINKLVLFYKELILNIRELDKETPIIIESTYWAHINTLKYLVDCLCEQNMDKNIILSCHFYEPKLLTEHKLNKEKFHYPDSIPIWKKTNVEKLKWDRSLINSIFNESIQYANEKGFRVFIGELGICRNIAGANEYLKDCIEACHTNKTSCCLYSFRDDCWDKMNYELGTDKNNMIRLDLEDNDLFKTIIKLISF